MSTFPPRDPQVRGVTVAISGLLVAAAVVYLGYHLSNALGPDDAGRLETLLIGAVAGEFDHGLGALYGPFKGDHRLVLIHAPLFYRVAALFAWPLKGSGIATTQAALVAGRFVSIVSTVGLFALVFRLTTLDGVPKRAGLWAACLLAASPVFGVLAVMVRPDALAVFFQTLGVYLVLRAVRSDTPQTNSLVAAFAALAFGFCTRQSAFVEPVVCSSLLLMALWDRRVRLGSVVLAHGTFLAILGIYLGFEELLTRGMMSQSVFILPAGAFRVINYASWTHVTSIGLSIAKLSAGLFAVAGASLAVSRVKDFARVLDIALLVCLAAELATFVPLCLFNKGSAENYALQAIVFGCVLVARALARVPERARGWKAALTVIAVAFLLARDAKLVVHALIWDRADRVALREMLADRSLASESPSERYFVDLPQHNRRFGAADLIHDEWLFSAYEAIGDVQPRAMWLRPVFVHGPVHTIIVPDERETIPGLAETLPELGYALAQQFGRYRVWERPVNATASVATPRSRQTEPQIQTRF